MIQFVSGKPGAGKGLVAMKILVHELRTTKRHIFTNLAVRREELAAYLHERYDDTFDLLRRLHLFTDEEAAKFWLHRPGVVLHQCTVKDCEECARPAFPSGDGGVLYICDEIQNFFNSRKWQSTGVAALFYLSQHRKLGDDVICITQSIANVDKQFRSMAQDFCYVTNHSKEKFLTLFRQPPFFSFRKYLTPVTGASTETPMEFGTFRLDVEGLAKCYDTSAGVGIVGGALADTQTRTRGLSILWLIPIIFCGLWLLVRVPGWGLGGIMRVAGLSSAKLKASPVVSSSGTASNGVQKIPAPLSGGPAPVGQPSSTTIDATTNEVFVTGLFSDGKSVIAYLSDGSEVQSGDPLFSRIGRTFIVYAGRLIPFARPVAVKVSDTMITPGAVSTVVDVRLPEHRQAARFGSLVGSVRQEESNASTP